MSTKKQPVKQRVIPQDRTQINLNAKSEVLEKLKYIAFAEGVSNTDIYNLAFDRFIEAYESKHGKVKPKITRQGLDKL